jgi:hypothetical protein
VRVDDLAAQGKSESRAGGLGGEEGQQRIAQRLLAEADTTVGPLDQKTLRALGRSRCQPRAARRTRLHFSAS